MNSDDLFPEAHSLSPCLAWLKKHGLYTCEKKQKHEYQWICASKIKPIMVDGVDENDAIMNYCADQKIKHWTLE